MRERTDLLKAAGPAFPSARLFVVLSVILAIMAGQFVGWSHGRYQPLAEEAMIAAIWAGLTLAASLTAFGFVPVSRWLFDHVPACRSGLAAWIAVYGVFGLAQGTLMAGRSVAGHLWIPDLFHVKAAMVAAVNGFVINMLLFALAERSAAGDRDVRDHQDRLRRLSEELTRTKTRMVADDDRMRAEVARMLHGELQTLLLLSWADLGAAAAHHATDRSVYEVKLRQVEQRLGQAAETLDSGLAGWLDSIEDADDLGVALEHLVASFAHVLCVKLDMNPRLQESKVALSPIVTRAAFRLVQEALLNALKHARAREVRVSGEPSPDGGITLRVTDDGRGFGAGRMRGGIGFTVMGKELEAHGGTWSVSSSPGRGTRLQISLPAGGTGA